MNNEKQVPLPLGEIKILDLTRLIPGAVCTSILADAGAEVIKIEEIETGDYERQIHPFIGSMAARFLILNRNKKSVAVDLKKEKGRDFFLKLLNEADVLVEGFRPGAMKKLGLDYESLRRVNKQLIYCSISSFGSDGPYKDVVAHDINILGMSGFFEITGMKSGEPVIPGVQVADSLAGMNAAIAILIALQDREKRDVGQFVDISMFDGVVGCLFDAFRYVFAGAKVPPGGEGRLWGGFPNYNLYKTRDGKYLAVGSLENKFKRVLLKELGWNEQTAESGATSSQAGDSDQELHDFLANAFLARSRDEWMEKFDKLNICVSPVNTIEEALENPQLVYLKMVEKVDHHVVGKIDQMGSPLKFSDITINPNRLPAPLLGQHTHEVLKSLGYGEAEINELLGEAVVRSVEAV